MEKLPRLDHDDATSLTTFNIIVEGDGEGLISKIFSKFKTAVSGPQQSTSPSSSTRTITIMLSNESDIAVEDAVLKNSVTGEADLTSSASSITSSTIIAPITTTTTAVGTPTTTATTTTATSTATASKRASSIATITESNIAPVIITKTPSTAPTSSSSKSTIKRIIIDEEQNQQQEILYPPSMLIPLTKTPSCDSDTQSVMTTFSVSNTNSLSRILNRLRGESDSNKDFWMPDEQCRECFDCNAPFNIFRRKHHCRACGKLIIII